MYGLRALGSFTSDVEPPCLDPLATVRYLCVHLVDHLCVSGRKDVLRDYGLVHIFLEKEYLCWLEALSLVVGMSDGVLAMRKLESFLVSTSGTISALF